jgi:phage terminase large subunit-like protein
VWPNGAAATLYAATEPDTLRGPEHSAAWCDELAKWAYQTEVWDMLRFGLRAGLHPQVCITTTPRPTKLLKAIIADPETVMTRGSTFENRSNLPATSLQAIERRYGSTRLGRQELFGEILEDVPGALWSRPLIDGLRIKVAQLPVLTRIVIAIDPAMTTGEDSDETGIIAVGLGEDGHGYLLDDVSGRYSPTEWARQAVSLYHARRADRIVAERNAGGDLVENTVRQIDPSVSFRSVWASRGKYVRAEPVSALYEQRRIHHVGSFPILEDQLCSWIPDMDRASMGSPDRGDALVWALTELMIDHDDEDGRPLFISIPMGSGRPRQAHWDDFHGWS